MATPGIDKRELIKKFEARAAADLAVLTQAALNAHEAATHAESKAEDQYDTRGLEASYLAGAQSKRAMELQEVVDIYRFIDIKAFGPGTPIASTAVIELRHEGGLSYYLMMPKGGGMSLTHEGKLVQVITPQSPLGEALLGRKVGDEVEVHIQRALKDYEITSVW